jgi:excisionase family DNA binding protein
MWDGRRWGHSKQVKDMIEEEVVYRPSEVARVLRVSAVTISRAILSGQLRALRVGGQWRILGSDLMAFVNDGTAHALGKTASGPAGSPYTFPGTRDQSLAPSFKRLRKG